RHAKDHSVKIYSKGWKDVIRWKLSIWPQTLPFVAFSAAYSTLICIFFLVEHADFLKRIPNTTLFIAIMGAVMSLLLSFRLSTAYDRYWEGRKLWSSLRFQCLNLARQFKVFAPATTLESETATQRALLLVSAIPIAIKHRLRKEHQTTSVDLAPLLREHERLKELPASRNMPMMILMELQAYLMSTGPSVLIKDASNVISSMGDTLSALERIRSTPIPGAYRIQLLQVIGIYFLALPFQLVGSVKWLTIAVCAIATFVVVGFLVIAEKIENPFGYDIQDLPLDLYCEEIRLSIQSIAAGKGWSGGWIKPHKLEIHPIQSKNTSLDACTRASEDHSSVGCSQRLQHSGQLYEEVATV
ncbi:Bestrophin, RFP-TM, chloride channel-domain-containing protein, partial [Chytriomyces sp. MP71]